MIFIGMAVVGCGVRRLGGIHVGLVDVSSDFGRLLFYFSPLLFREDWDWE
jgi:hypothetical protein